ncbi:hypothetical protein CBQ26_20115 [Deinococcus indicus]|uniref:Uncharacterized protein n=1 Tax=Deinococcus indicus TaxID=223556 RepID=A0A2D0A708_9DEIO|nr:hypothetical protein CBQ26_20115 [Deinococcus indicus]
MAAGAVLVRHAGAGAGAVGHGGRAGHADAVGGRRALAGGRDGRGGRRGGGSGVHAADLRGKRRPGPWVLRAQQQRAERAGPRVPHDARE